MELYQEAITRLENQPQVQEWPEMAASLHRAGQRVPISCLLPRLTCQAFGGEEQLALPGIAAMTAAQISILLVDDMLDKDPRGEYHQIGAGRAANLAIAFASLAVGVLQDAGAPRQPNLAAQAMLNMLSTVARGQDLDVQNHASEAAYWRVTHAKSAGYFGTAFYLGALHAGADPKEAEKLEQVGETYGEMMQIHDDLNDCLADEVGPDWLQGRYSLPILFAAIVDHPQRSRFLDLRRHISAPGALVEVQSILVECGAISYCVNELIQRHESARRQLASIRLKREEELTALLDEVMEPVESLFAAVGAEARGV